MLAQNHSLEIIRIIDEKGNTPNSTSSFVQDKNGFIWIGTTDGLFRYDGYNFKIYTNDKENEKSISNNVIRALEIDKNGNIWIGTQGGGLNKYNYETEDFSSYRNDSNDKNSVCSNNIEILYCDEKNNLWIGSWDEGLDKFNIEQQQFKHYKHLKNNNNSISSNEIRQIYEDKEGYIWIGTLTGGLDKLNTQTNKIEHYRASSSEKSLVNNSVYAICEDNSGLIWIGTTGGGLQILNKKTGEFSHFKKNEISNIIFSIKIKKDGTLVVASDKGLYLIMQDKLIKIDTETHTNLKTNRLRTVFIDRDDNLWIGTEVGAKRLIEHTAFIQFRYQVNNENSLAGRIVRSVYEDKEGILWIGTLGQGLNKYDKNTGKITRIPFSEKEGNLLGSEITSMLEDSLGNFWIGCWGKGLILFDKKTEKVLKKYQKNVHLNSLTDNRIQAIIEEKKGVLWVSTENGLNKFDYLSQKWTNFKYNYTKKQSVSGNKFQSKALIIDKKGIVWAGTWANGLNAIIPTKNIKKPYKFLHWKNNFSKSNSLSSNSIISLFLDKKENLWIGTYGGGVNFVRAKQLENVENRKIKFENYTTDNNLVNNIVYGILEDENNNIWFSTDNGLSSFNQENLKFRNYKTENGVLNNQFFWGASFSTPEGKLYFGSVDGLNLIEPEKIKINKKKLHLEITEIIFNDQEKQNSRENSNINIIKEVELSSNDPSITVKYIALNYNVADEIKYSYKLEGFDKKWNFVGTKKEISFNNLNPGTYVFMLRAIRNNETSTPEYSLLTIKVLSPWWNTWWFLLFVSLFSISIIAFFYFRRIDNLKKQKYELELKVKLRTEELFKKNKEFKAKNESIARQKEEAELQKQKTELINKELNDFAYIISHDLKAPLRGINQLASWISIDYSDKFDEDGKEQLKMLIERVNTMDGMIDGVLQYSRATNFIGKFEKIDLNDLLKEIIDLILSPSHIKIEILNKLPHIECDRVRMMQVFQNLISNSIKYMDKVEGLIKIRSFDKDTHWQFDVEDNGEGIDPKYHENIFKIFQTVDSTRKESTGIGLSIVKKIIHIYKGKIWIESKLGKGSKFSFTIAKKIG